jgi:hypothetical protein
LTYASTQGSPSITIDGSYTVINCTATTTFVYSSGVR